MNYRLKTHDELLATGFALTPAGVYTNATGDKLTPAMREYATGFSNALVQVLFDAPSYAQRQFIDEHIYCAQHFVAEPHLKLA